MSQNREQLNDRALELLKAYKLDEYREMMEVMVQEHPEDAHVRLHYGTALGVTRPDEAIEQLRAAVELAPDDPVTLTQAASRLFELGEFGLSQKFVSRPGRLVTLSEFVLGSDLVNLAGRLAAEQGDDDRARALLQAAVDVGSEDREHARYAKDLARFLASRGAPDPAREAVADALADHPDDVELRWMASTDPQAPSEAP